MKKRLLVLICGLLCICLFTGCGNDVVNDFLNPVTEEPEPEVTTEHNYAVNGPNAKTTETTTEITVETEVTTQTDATEVKEPFSYIGTIKAPDSYNDIKYGSSPLSSIYLAYKYSALNKYTYETDFAKYESANPDKFMSMLDDDVLNSLILTIPSLSTDPNELSEEESAELKDIGIERDDTGNIILTDELRDNYISNILYSNGIVVNTNELQSFYDGYIIPNGVIRSVVVVNGIDFSNDTSERENATEVTIDDTSYKVYTLVDSKGIDHNGIVYGSVSYIIYTLDGSDNNLDLTNYTSIYNGYIETLNITAFESVNAIYQKADTKVFTVEYEITDATEESVVYDTDFPIYDSDGNQLF